MITSFFPDSFCTDIDYSDREDCLLVVDLPIEDIQKLQLGMDYKIVKGKLTIYEGEKWQEIMNERNNAAIREKELRKTFIINELGKLNNELQGMEMLGIDTEEIQTKIQVLKDEYNTL